MIKILMLTSKFVRVVKAKTGCAVIFAGSDSDDKSRRGKLSHIEQIIESLEAFGIPYDVRIKSAHKQPEELMEVIREYDALRGSVVLVAIAGGTDALSGIASYHALSGPVISCPPDAPNESCLRNPPGSSNAYISKPSNVGKFIAQIYAPFNSTIREKLEASNISKIEILEEGDVRINTKYTKRQEDN